MATVAVRLRNTGAGVDEFTFQVLGDASAWATVEPPKVSLFPGAEGTTTITFAPPRSPKVRAGRLPFGFRIASKEDPAGSVVEEGSVDVAPFTELTAEIVPRSSRGSSGATHDVAIDNRGNVPLNATIAAEDADRLLAFDVRPPAILADPGVAVFTKVRVRPKRTFWRGAAATRPFQVSVTAPEATPIVLDGSLLQTAIPPSWTFRALPMALVLDIAAYAAWNGLIKPAVESSARDQAVDVLAGAGITLQPSGGGASASPTASGGGPSPSSDSSASPDPSASLTPTTPPTLPPGLSGATPTDGRLVAGVPASTPAPGKTLYLTDLVFSNPEGQAVGEIRLERSGKPLIVLQLQNFRDIDFHFVTPIVVSPDQNIALVCPDGCSGAALFYSGFQR
jgi:hypothetical protein